MILTINESDGYVITDKGLFDLSNGMIYDYVELDHEGVAHGLNQAGLDKLISESKREIAQRQHCLNRWESWEVPDGDPAKLCRLLMGRSRNREEKELVARLMKLALENE